jgi:hypothetical protein
VNRKHIRLIGVALVVIVAGLWLVRRFWLLPVAPQEIFARPDGYVGRRFRIQGCFVPRQCTMAQEGCSLEHLRACCDCIRNYGGCLGVDVQAVERGRLRDVRQSDEARYYVEIKGTVIPVSEMRPIAIRATGLTILGRCPAE